jgi:hypothetical protein
MKSEIKSGNFAASIEGTLTTDAKLVGELLEAGLQATIEREVLSKVFKGVAKRSSVAFTADSAKVFSDKLRDAVAKFFGPDLNVGNATKRVFTAEPVGVKARKAYDEAFAQAKTLGLDDKIAGIMALSAAQSHQKDFDPSKVEKEEHFKTETVAAVETPMEG